MLVVDLSTENSGGSLTVIERPTWAQIELAIRELDADTRTLTTIGLGGDTHLAIGGGDGYYLVYATYDNQTFQNLVNPQMSQGRMEIVVGRQTGEYPRHHIVGLESALRAARVFAESGALAPDLVWEKQR